MKPSRIQLIPLIRLVGLLLFIHHTSGTRSKVKEGSATPIIPEGTTSPQPNNNIPLLLDNIIEGSSGRPRARRSSSSFPGIELWTPLHAAASSCNLTAMKELVIKRGAAADGVSPKDHYGRTPILLAVQSNCVPGVDLLLAHGAKVNQVTSNRDSLLHSAAVKNHIKMLSFLLAHGGRLEARNKQGLTPLHFAIQQKGKSSSNAVKYLIARGADVRTKSGVGNTLLHTAVLEKVTLPLVEILVQAGVDPNARNRDNLTPLELSDDDAGSPVHEYLLKVEKNPYEFTTTTTTTVAPPPDSSSPPQVPLEYNYISLKEAIESGDLEAVRFRVSAAGGGDSVSSMADGRLPIHIAAGYGHRHIVQFLVEEAGADVNAVDAHVTPIFTAVRARQLEVLRYLVAHGANLSATNPEGETALHLASSWDNLEQVQILVEGGAGGAGADVNAKDRYGRSPLHKTASASGRYPVHIVHYLAEHGALLNASDWQGNTFLAYVVRFVNKYKEPVSLLEYLVGRDDGGAEDLLAARNNKGESLLHHAARGATPLPVLQFLVQSGGGGVEMLNGRDEDGNTPLHIAAAWLGYAGGGLEVIQYLVQSGADTDAENKEGKRPEDCYPGGNADIKRLLAYPANQFTETDAIVVVIMESSTTPSIPETTTLAPLLQIGTIIPPWFDLISVYEAVAMGNLDAVKYRASVAGDNVTAPNRGVPGAPGPIHIAAKSGELSILKYLVEEAGVPLDSRTFFGWTPLHYGAEGCHLDVIQYLVEEKGLGVNLRYYRAEPPVFAAKGPACTKAMSYLLEKGAEPAGGADENTLLHLAAAENSVQKIAVLLDHGEVGVPLLEAKRFDGATPLQVAVGKDRLNAAKYLIARGADLETKLKNGHSLLHTAVQEGAGLPLVEYLVESAGVDLNARDGGNETALELSGRWCHAQKCPLRDYLRKVEEKNSSDYTTTTTSTTEATPDSTRGVPLEYEYMDLKEAIESGNLDAVRFRVSTAGDNVSTQTADGLAPVHLASKSGNLAILKYLVEEAGADVNTLSDRRRSTPLHYSVQSKSTQLARYLVSRGANLGATNRHGATALHEAAQGKYLEPVEYLVGIGAEMISAEDNLGRSPLHWAAENCRQHVMYFLVERNASLHVRDRDGDTPLATAVYWSSKCWNPVPIIKYLVRSGADLHTRNKNGKMLLHHAAASLSPGVLQFLIRSGLEVNVKDKDGNTPLHDVAGSSGFDAEQLGAIRILIGAGADLNAENKRGRKPVDMSKYWSDEARRLLTPKK